MTDVSQGRYPASVTMVAGAGHMASHSTQLRWWNGSHRQADRPASSRSPCEHNICRLEFNHKEFGLTSFAQIVTNSYSTVTPTFVISSISWQLEHMIEGLF